MANSNSVALAPVEVWVNRERTEDHLSIALPGVNPDDIQVSLEGNDLTVSAVCQESDSKRGATFVQQEANKPRSGRTDIGVSNMFGISPTKAMSTMFSVYACIDI